MAQAGWTGGADGFTFVNNITAQDPLFALADPGTEQWSLCGGVGSPALSSATDGTNIGAWQGSCGPTCAAIVNEPLIVEAYPAQI